MLPRLLTMGARNPLLGQGHPTAVVTITGSEQSAATGSITISLPTSSGTHTETVNYGQFSTASSIASAFGAYFSEHPNTTAPPLCIVGLCAKSDGPNVIFTLEDDTSFQPIVTSTTGSSFGVDTSQWPGNLIPSPPMSVNCSPAPVVIGNSVSCAASLPTNSAGTVTFTIDGSAWQSNVVVTNGLAQASGGLTGASLGEHLIAAQYTSAYHQGQVRHTASAYTAAEVIPAGAANPTTVYYYSITTSATSGATPPTASTTGYSPNGNITAYNDMYNGTWSNMTYDSLNRLIAAAQGPAGSSAVSQYNCWAYDSFGNRTFESYATNSIEADCDIGSSTGYYGSLLYFTSANAITNGGAANTNQITGGATKTSNGLAPWPNIPSGNHMYDAIGNYTYDATYGYQYLYDDQGHVCAAYNSGGWELYLYDAEGQRVAKAPAPLGTTPTSCDPGTNGFVASANAGNATYYELDPGGAVMTEVVAGAWSRTHISAGGQQIASYDSNGVHFHIHDWLGTVRAQTDYAGNVQEYCTNQPFGDYQNCSNTSLEASDNHFTGKERDAESGLDYFGARYYASNMGRWMSPDWADKPEAVPYSTLGNPQSLNLYGYVGNNPLSRADADGHCWVAQSVCDFFTNTGQRIGNLFTGYGFHTNAQVDDVVEKTRAVLKQTGANTGDLSYKQTYKLGTAKLHQGVNSIDVGDGVTVTLTFAEKVANTLNHINTMGEAPSGYEGGRTFENREGRLPTTDASGNPIKYQEWDVNPRQPGVNRGPERVVTGSDGSQYSTNDHYDSFTKIR